ncbi:hypothetical protein ACOSQ4_014175 [Xanthoceras sorbifolium]
MDYDLKFMLNTIDDDNHASIGVEDEVIHSPYFSELPTHTSTAGATNSALDDPLQMLHVQSCNVLGKEFLCIQEAEEYYHKYLYLKEFNVQKDDLHCDKNGLTTVYRWVCFKEGFRENKYVERTNRVHQPRGQTREGCRAATRVNFDPQKMVRGVKEFFIEHSYNLTSSKHTWFLCSHRNVKESDMSILHSLKAVGVKPSQVMDQMVHTKKDLQNRIDAKCRTMLTDSDADVIIGYMTAKSETDTEFFYKYDVNEDGALGNLFWVDYMSYNDYRNFSHVLCFDSTYKTNAYRRPLVIFVGVNHHNKTIVFGFRLSVNETVETYSWILKTFLLAMHENYPILVVTNGDKAMRKAIKPEMSGSIHRLCSWHLKRNVQTNFRDSGFTRSFTHCMNQWHSSVDMFGLHENEWVKKMYSKRKQWVETFLSDTFFGAMRSTQRSENINAYLNRFLHYQWRDCNNKMKDDFEKLNEHPILVTHLLQLEKHASEVYTRGIFQLVSDEIKAEMKLNIYNCVDDDSQTYTFKKFGRECYLYTTAAIPCSHSFSVMKALNMHHIPDTLLMSRWTMNVMLSTFDLNC